MYSTDVQTMKVLVSTERITKGNRILNEKLIY